MSETGETDFRKRPRMQTFEALTDRNFRLLWTANLFFYVAFWGELVVLGWLVVDITDSPWLLGVVLFLRMGPGQYISVGTGVLLDRLDRRKLALFIQIGNASMAGIMALLILTGWLQFWHIMPIAVVSGIFWAIDFTLRRTLVSDVVEPERLTNALALEASAITSAMIFGPFATGVVIDVLGAGQSYLTIAFMFVICFLLLSVLRTKGNGTPILSESVVKSFVEGIRYVSRHPVLLPALGVTLFMNLFVFVYQQFLPVFAKDVLMVDATGLGSLTASIGAGALAGTLVQASQGNFGHRGWVYLGGSTILILGALLFTLSIWFPLSLLILFLTGLGFSGFHSMQGNIMLSASSDEMRGRVMGILMIGLGAGPLGVLLVGAMASAWGTPVAVRISVSIGALVLAAMALGFPKLRRYS